MALSKSPPASTAKSVADIPSVFEHPEYRELQAKLQGVRSEIADLSRRISESSGAPAVSATERVRHAASALLDGEPGGHADTPGRMAEARQLHERLAVLREAERQAKERLQAVKARVSAEIVESVAPSYRTLVEEMAAAIYQLGLLSDRERAFRVAFDDAGVPFAGRLFPMPLGSLSIEDDQSRGSRWLAEAGEHHGVQLPQLERLRREQIEARERVALADAKEQMKGGCTSAGPDGIVEYRPGQKPRRTHAPDHAAAHAKSAREGWTGR